MYNYLLGLDKVGKGEIFGGLILCGVLVRHDKTEKLAKIFENGSTKTKRSWEYWNTKHDQILNLNGIRYDFNYIRPYDIEQNSMKNLMDAGYYMVANLLPKKTQT